MQLQPVVMNVFPPNPVQNAPAAGNLPGNVPGATSANALGNTDDSPLLKVLEQAQALSNDQDRRVADALRASVNSRSSTSKLFSLLQLQYELDDMQFNATLASGIASKLSQAVTSLTQRT